MLLWQKTPAWQAASIRDDEAGSSRTRSREGGVMEWGGAEGWGRGHGALTQAHRPGLERTRPGKVPGPAEPIPLRHLPRLRAPRARRRGSRVGTSLSSQRYSLLPEPTWAEQRGGVRGRGLGGGCCARGAGVQAGRPRPPPRRLRPPTSVPPRPGHGGTRTYSVGRTPREPAGHAPRATPWRQPVGPPPPPWLLKMGVA